MKVDLMLMRSHKELPATPTLAESAYVKALTDIGYAQCSEVVEVDFPELGAEEFMKNQLAVIDAAEQKVRADFQVNLDRLQASRAELLSLENKNV